MRTRPVPIPTLREALGQLHTSVRALLAALMVLDRRLRQLKDHQPKRA